MSATTQGGSSGATGELDPYTWCDWDLGAANNPRCTFPGSTCGNPWCAPPCADTAGPGDDCPLPLTGNADRVCNFNQCNLLCDEGQTCPDGMECTGSTCRWSLNCGVVYGESEQPAYRLTLLASGFESFEFVHARIFVESDVHSAMGRVQIRDGAFEWTRSNLLDEGAAAQIVVYFDENANDACDAEEPAWQHIMAPVTEDTTVELEPGSTGWESLPVACMTSDGTDLTTPSQCLL